MGRNVGFGRYGSMYKSEITAVAVYGDHVFYLYEIDLYTLLFSEVCELRRFF